jgi:methionyl-tRNA formyltransferase
MRVGFFGQSGPYAPIALRYLIEHQTAFEVVLAVEGLKGSGLGREHRMRTPRPGPLPAGEDLAPVAVAGGVPCLQTRDVNGRAAVATMQEHGLDVIVCVGFDRLFKPAVLETARRGGINAHPSRLPQLRGPSPVFWALKQGLRELAVTLHALDAKEDHGPIYAQESFLLPPRASGRQIFEVAARLAGPMLAALLERAAAGSLHGRPQNHAEATRAPRPKPEDSKVEPGEWDCEPLVDFACGAGFFRAAWLRLGNETFHVRRGLEAEPGRRIPAQYLLQGTRLILQARDGVAHLEIQA